MSNARARRILVADDSDTVTMLLATTLKSAGYRVVTAGDGLEAYEIGTEHRIDLAVLDHLMPGLLGMEVLEKWRAEGLDFPVVVLSGVEDENTVVDYLRMGAVDFVRKPFRTPELFARIALALGAR